MIKIEGGATISLDISNASVSAGYIPQADDQVMFSYDKDNMMLKDIQLMYRPPQETAPAADSNSGSDNGSDSGSDDE